MTAIRIEVERDIKNAFEAITAESQKELSSIFEWFLRQILHNKNLFEVMAEISDRTQQRGLRAGDNILGFCACA